jgi:hypothetical protein
MIEAKIIAWIVDMKKKQQISAATIATCIMTNRYAERSSGYGVITCCLSMPIIECGY